MKGPEEAKLPVSENILSVLMKTRSSLHYKKRGNLLKQLLLLVSKEENKRRNISAAFLYHVLQRSGAKL